MPLYSDLVHNADHWSNWDFDHAALINAIGAGTQADSATVRTTILGHAARSPTVGVFCLVDDPEHIYVGHTPTIYPAEVGNPSPLDNHISVLVGNELSNCVTITFPDDSFSRATQRPVYTMDYITGPNGHGAAAGAVHRFTTPAGGTADTTNLRTRAVFVLARAMGEQALILGGVNGKISLSGFYNQILAPELGSGNADRVTAVTPLAEWYRYAVHDSNGGDPQLEVTPVPVVTLANRRSETAFTKSLVDPLLAKLGVGGPGLTTAAFTQGITEIRNTLTTTTNNTLDYHRQQNNKTFTAKHGTALAARVYRLTGATDDATLPEIHRLVAAASKAQAHNVVASAVEDRVAASPVPLTLASKPLITPKLLTCLFRNYQIYATGITYGEGLTPFAMVCEGHAERDEVVKRIHQAIQAEQGTSLSLDDAMELTTNDLRFPTTPQQVSEKLYAWSAVVDVWFGNNAQISQNVRSAVTTVGPVLHRIFEMHADNARHGLDLVLRVAYELQQDFFSYLNQKAVDDTTTEPTFQHIKDKVLSFRADALSPLPPSWYAKMNMPPAQRGSGMAGAPEQVDGRPTMRGTAGVVGGTNAHADQALLARFAGCGHTSIKELMEGHTTTIPKQGGKEVCLAWALRGSCTRACRRADMHVRYSAATVRKLNQLLTDCGVTATQD